MSIEKQTAAAAIQRLLSVFAKAVNEFFLNSPNVPADIEHNSLVTTIKAASSCESLLGLAAAFRGEREAIMMLDFTTMLSHASEFESVPYMLDEQILADLQPLGSFIELSTISSSPGAGASVSLQFTLAPTSPFLKGIERMVTLDVSAADGDEFPASLIIGILEFDDERDTSDLTIEFNQEDGSCKASATVDDLFHIEVTVDDLHPTSLTQPSET